MGRAQGVQAAGGHWADWALGSAQTGSWAQARTAAGSVGARGSRGGRGARGVRPGRWARGQCAPGCAQLGQVGVLCTLTQFLARFDSVLFLSH